MSCDQCDSKKITDLIRDKHTFDCAEGQVIFGEPCSCGKLAENDQRVGFGVGLGKRKDS
jgi:hypothetical protein